MSTAATTAAAGGVKHVLVPVADGSEEIESVTIIDTLVRAGASVTVASVSDGLQVRRTTCNTSVLLWCLICFFVFVLVLPPLPSFDGHV